MEEKIKHGITPIVSSYPEIKLVYFFGSRANGNSGPLSDYDFAVYFSEVSKTRMSEIKLELFSKISKLLKTDNRPFGGSHIFQES